MISIIVAVANNQAIGKNNDLLWHLPGDLIRFKKITSGHAVIMGKNTWESLPRKPLVNRVNIVITDNMQDVFEGALRAGSIEEALGLVNNDDENFVIGGASVYRQFLPLCDRIYLTRVFKDFEADVFFPEIDPEQWNLVSREDFPPEGENDFSFSYLIYDRVR
jgi:dihydrofolate reductase